ncbi:hypothetical protein KIN20_004817 [Parelaphostrongylus tenuis]|uniref:Uncharacterized protein n=1 Tax=Parelaphostrongylus tenuis TaxID=148309 RepID=A0AAD5MRY1_PARTN|nr:hypothetical protein KIN20_004817 [Parelaphostrongylus tenuis]
MRRACEIRSFFPATSETAFSKNKQLLYMQCRKYEVKAEFGTRYLATLGRASEVMRCVAAMSDTIESNATLTGGYAEILRYEVKNKRPLEAT